MSEPPIAPLLDAIRAAIAWLGAVDVRAAVVGGVAASIHGRPRVTKDVDLVALAEVEDCGSLVSSAGAHGIVPRMDDVVEFARSTRVLLLRHVDSGVEIDLSLGALPFERELVEKSEIMVVARVQFPLARAEDIIIMKALALRPRDIADIEAIVECNPNLDLARVRSTVEAFSHLLEERDFLAELDRIVGAVRR